MRRYLIIALLIGLSLTSAPLFSEESESSFSGAANKVWDGVKSGSQEAWEATKEGSNEAWEATKEGSGEVWDATKEGSSEAWEATKEGFGKARKSVGGAISGE